MKPAIDSSDIAALIAAADAQKGAPQDVVPALLRALRRHLGMDAAFVAEFAEGRRLFRYVDAAVEGAPRPGDSDALQGSYCLLVAEGRIPELISDASRVAPESAFVVGRPVGAQLCVPMALAEGRTWGTFCCFSREPDPSLSERDLSLAAVFAGLALQAIERGRAAEASLAEIRKRITHVLKLDKVHAVFQPVYTLEGRRVAGFECLSRFDAEPQQGPEFWFAEAASVGLGAELELGVIRRALPALERLPSATPVSFNVSPQLLLDGRLERELATGANGARLAARLILEVTEHETVKEHERLVTALEPLRRMGVRVAIDDAGAGYSSFRHIVRLGPDVIKLDLRLTRDIDHDPARRALAAALIRYARETRAEVIAEGVETQAELDTLRELGIAKAQGYFFGRPLALSAALELADALG
ncbi:MAG TPA: EAL domain-containing protein, partial [Burkholderiales bacterium]|nr:EAL domain-containing protein [Burkholderiales bacterium]